MGTAAISAALLLGVSYEATTNSSGAPTSIAASNGYAGAPAENGRTCATAGCHNGPATAKDDMITVQGLQNGAYVPGETYLVEVGTAEASTRWGFQASIQTPAGVVAGSLATRDNETRIPQVSGYITHTSQGTSGSNTKMWQFDWTAPSAGTGDVGVYVAINASNANGTTSGDNILYDELIIPEGQPTGLAPKPKDWQVANWQVTGTGVFITVEGHPASPIMAEVFTISGQRLAASPIDTWSGQQTIELPLPGANALYLVRLSSADNQWVQKVVLP